MMHADLVLNARLWRGTRPPGYRISCAWAVTEGGQQAVDGCWDSNALLPCCMQEAADDAVFTLFGRAIRTLLMPLTSKEDLVRQSHHDNMCGTARRGEMVHGIARRVLRCLKEGITLGISSRLSACQQHTAKLRSPTAER
jgi:hypothetical protein